MLCEDAWHDKAHLMPTHHGLESNDGYGIKKGARP